MLLGPWGAGVGQDSVGVIQQWVTPYSEKHVTIQYQSVILSFTVLYSTTVNRHFPEVYIVLYNNVLPCP